MNTEYPSDAENSSDDYYLTDGYDQQVQEDQSIYTWQSSAIRAGAVPQWQNPYLVAYHANLVMETVEKLKGSTDPSILNPLRGAALFFRAYAFWQVAQLYAKPYNAATAGQDPGIPLRLTSDINDVSSRGTVQQTYDQMVKDLQEAAGLLPATATISSRPSKGAVYAMLARVYLTMENYPAALSNATAALQINNKLIDFNTLDVNTESPFARFNAEVYFHSLTNDITNPNSTMLIDPTYAKVSTDIVTSYKTDDLRKVIFLKNNGDGTFHFTGNYEPFAYMTLFNGLAVDEVYLTRAECYARAGDAASAMSDLNTLLKSRWKTGKYVDMSAANADDALAKVLVERRKELIMRSTRWTDLRRLNKDPRFAVTLTRVVNGTTYTLPPNDLRYTLLIPNQVIMNSNLAQNPR